MEIVSPSGRVYKWDSPTPPTAEDIAALQAYDAAQGGAAPSAPAGGGRTANPASPAAPNLLDRMLGRSPEAVARSAERRRGVNIQSDMGLATLPRDEQREFYAGVTRYAPPVIAGIMTGGVAGPLVAAGMTGLAGAAGELAAQGIEGQGYRGSEIAKSGIVNALPVGTGIQAAGKLAGAARMGLEAGKVATAEATGETARRSIEAGELTRPYESPADMARSLAVPAAIGGGLGGVGELARKLATRGAERATRGAVLARAGIEKPSLDMIWPSQAALVESVAKRSPVVAQARIDAKRTLTDQVSTLTAAAPDHEAVYAQLRPYVGQLDALREAVAGLEAKAAQSVAAALRAQQAAEVTPALRAQLTAQATVDQLNAVSARARHLYEQQNVLGDLLSPTSIAEEFTGLTSKLFKARGEVADTMFKAAGVPAGPIFPKARLVEVARSSLSSSAGTHYAKEIVDAIESVPGDALTLQQFRELRDGFSARFGALDPRQLRAAQAASKQAYGALTEASLPLLAAQGVDVPAYQAAVGYWRDTAEAAASRYARPLLSDEPAISTFQTLARDVMSGNNAEIRAFNEFVAAVKPASPDLAKSAERQLTAALRNSFLSDAVEGAGINGAKLAKNLLATDKRGGFDIRVLGWGDAADVQRWGQIFQRWNLENLPEADFAALFATPQFQQALGQGRPISSALEPAAARIAFGEAVRRQVLADATKNLAAKRTAAAEAQAAARAAGLTLDEQRAVLAQVEADPIAQAFAGGQDFAIPARPGGATGGGGTQPITTTALNLGPVDGGKLFTALRARNPVLADEVERRVFADAIGPLFRPSSSPGQVWAIDKAVFQRLFHPAPGSREATHTATLKTISGGKPWGTLEKMLGAIEMLADAEKASGAMTTDGARTVYDASGLGRAIAGAGSVAGTAAGLPVLRGLRDLWQNGKHATLAWLAQPGPHQDAFFKAGGDINQALQTMPFSAQMLFLRDQALMRENRPPPPPTAPAAEAATPALSAATRALSAPRMPP